MIPSRDLRNQRTDAILAEWERRKPISLCYYCQANFEYDEGEEVGDARRIREGVHWSSNGYSQFIVCSLHYIRTRREREWQRQMRITETIAIFAKLAEFLSTHTQRSNEVA